MKELGTYAVLYYQSKPSSGGLERVGGDWNLTLDEAEQLRDAWNFGNKGKACLHKEVDLGSPVLNYVKPKKIAANISPEQIESTENDTLSLLF